MDLAVTLVKAVMRAFYTTREILVVDALILHEALRDDDLAYLMAINTKDLHKICGKLREDRFLTVHTRSELRPGNPRPSNRTWYYINYRHTIDAIKWRVYNIDKEVQGTTIPANEIKEYFCNFCKAEWTAMEVLDNVGPEGFLCHRCRHVLTFEADRNAGGHEQSTRLNDQFKFISELLPKIDASHIPECDFDRALSKARPVVRDATHQRAETIAVNDGSGRPMAVKGLTNTGPQSIAVNISTSDSLTEAEKEAERARKEKLAAQNALPSWMSNSTVTGESFAGTAGTGVVGVKKEDADQSTAQNKMSDNNATAQIDDIFEKLKAEQAAALARETGIQDDEEEEEYGSEEDDDEFEDVPATTSNSGLDTPVIKELTGDSSDERAIKRVKVEPEAKKEDVSMVEEEEEDDELEFEDV
ncbi:Transcription initiation factor IIE subunit alpha [Cladobotryum mycophilum]|uniref:Transcription initiation factor IIE subunit alpha n=1 Tax=Cladobotryum mycophilum TaxID=491253 RepID=A0ABR0SVN7_9HYPO